MQDLSKLIWGNVCCQLPKKETINKRLDLRAAVKSLLPRLDIAPGICWPRKYYQRYQFSCNSNYVYICSHETRRRNREDSRHAPDKGEKVPSVAGLLWLPCFCVLFPSQRNSFFSFQCPQSVLGVKKGFGNVRKKGVLFRKVS